jgi:chromosome transmission fidelity protein 8
MSSQSWPSVTPVHLASPTSTTESNSNNPLPQLLHTPSGLAILELQGTINFPSLPISTTDNDTLSPSSSTTRLTEVGHLAFPLYIAGTSDPNSGSWMKRVHFYIGRHQRMTGEIKKLAKPLAVLRKAGGGGAGGGGDGDGDALEVVEIVRWKILFASRPEPVSEHVSTELA